MEVYGKILSIILPIYVALFLIELYFERKLNAKVIKGMDSISSMSSGMVNGVKDVLGLSVSIITYSWLYSKIAITQVPDKWWVFALAFFALEFQGYVVHFLNHKVNFFWNRHVIHHSSEEYNLSCAWRQPISTFFNYFTILLIPAALIGISPTVIAIVVPVEFLLQYWYHTRLIGKMGFLEKILMTPSHHRVHHAVNKEYMDKNMGHIFIIWDKLFGTFQEELDDVPPVYGMSRPARTWNPVKINFQHFFLLLKDAYYTKNWSDKIRIWIMPTGWRPDDVNESRPIFQIENAYQYEKYNTKPSKNLLWWSWCQLVANYFLMYYFLLYIGQIGSPEIFYYGAFMLLSVFAYTELMDKNTNALYFEILKSVLGLFLVYRMGDWFGASQYVPFYTYFASAYFILSPLVVSWFTLNEFKNEKRLELI
jgi:alkylglycerol monooxygenase